VDNSKKAEELFENYKNNKRIIIHMKKLSILTIISVWFFIYSVSFADTVEIIQIHYRSSEDAFKIVENLLTKDGSVTLDQRTNSLVVKDSDESVARIIQVMEKFDKAIEQAKISIRFIENEINEGMAVSIKGGINDKHGKISSGGRSDGVDIRVKDRNKSKNAERQYFVRTASGTPAYIVTGRRVPYHERWVNLNRRNPVAMDTVVYENVETGFEITPVIKGDRADVKIVPRISDVENLGGVIRYSEAATFINVPLGEWVAIGGTDRNQNEVLQTFFENGGNGKESYFSISIKVER
jgi:type II secretory pathway component GspD/PulD (secretin)